MLSHLFINFFIWSYQLVLRHKLKRVSDNLNVSVISIDCSQTSNLIKIMKLIGTQLLSKFYLKSHFISWWQFNYSLYELLEMKLWSIISRFIIIEFWRLTNLWFKLNHFWRFYNSIYILFYFIKWVYELYTWLIIKNN